MTIKNRIGKNRIGSRAARGLLAAGFGATALMLGAAPALAQGKAEQTVDLQATVPSLCTMTDFSVGTLEIAVADGLPLTDTVSTETTVNCNSPSEVRLTSMSGGIVNIGVTFDGKTPVPNFAHQFDYVAEVKSGGTTIATLDTATDGAFAGEEGTGVVPAFDATSTTADMSISLEITPAVPAAGQTLMAGGYGDQLKLEILPTN